MAPLHNLATVATQSAQTYHGLAIPGTLISLDKHILVSAKGAADFYFLKLPDFWGGPGGGGVQPCP